MDLGTSLDVVGDVVDAWESGGWPVRTVETNCGEEAVRASIDLVVPFCPAGEESGPAPTAASLTGTGTVEVEIPATLPDLPDETGTAVSTEDRTARVDGGDVVLSIDLSIDPSGGTADGTERRDTGDRAETASGSADVECQGSSDRTVADTDAAASPAVRDESVPPYDDVEYLEWLYDSCDTFAEMSRLIELDVSAETVRRYMIEAGVHDPATYDTADQDPSAGASDGGAVIAEEHLVADGIGLPAELTIEDIADAVVESDTVYEVTRSLGLEQARTRDLLRQLNLLDLVLGHLGAAGREVSYETVATRVRQCAPEDAA